MDPDQKPPSRINGLKRICSFYSYFRNKLTIEMHIANTVYFLNIGTPKIFVVVTLKFELCGSTIE